MALSRRSGITQAINRHQAPISMLFLVGILLLLMSFGAAGYARSRRLGHVTTGIAVAGFAGTAWVMLPFLRVG